MAGITEQLRNHAPQRPSYASTLSQFSRIAVADEVGCSMPFLSSILTGIRIPGKKLEAKLKALAEKVDAEQGGHA